MNFNDCINHLNQIQRIANEIKNDLILMQKSPQGNHQEKIQLIQKKVHFIGQFSHALKPLVPNIYKPPENKVRIISVSPTGGMSKLDTIHFIFRTSKSLSRFYQDELGVTARDFDDQSVDSSLANQLISDAISDGIIQKLGSHDLYSPVKKK